MKHTRAVFASTAAIFALALTGCPPEPEHVHQWGAWVQTTAPTCTEAGVETRTCALDATHTETRDIAALGHNYGNWTVTTPATYTADGIETRTCSHDATYKETRPIPQLFYTAVSATNLETWLTNQPDNTAETPYIVKLNVSELGGSSDTAGSAGYVLKANNNTKYVSLDLSGSTITSIGNSAFSYCISLTSITIPDDVTSIGNSAFDHCYGLASVTIGTGVTSIGNNAFFSCNNLTAIDVNPSNTAYSSTDGVLYNKNKTALIQYPAGKTESAFIIPNGITSIGIYAFFSSGLISVTIPNGVTSIGDAVFYNCYSLASITIPNSVTSIGGQTFDRCASLASVTFQGTIPADNFGYDSYGNYWGSPFNGDLQAKFYATDSANGTPGTYTTTAPVSDSSVWTKQ